MQSGNSNNFMQNRNGIDEMAVVSLVLAVIFLIINLFANQLWITIVIIALVAYALFRLFAPVSQTLRDQNEHFVNIMGPVAPWLRNPSAAAKELKNYKHIQCPNCGQMVRVPRGKGAIRVTCPRCHTKFNSNS